MNQNYSTTALNNLSFTFYGFHLRNSLNQGETPVPEATQLWEQLTKLGQSLNIPELQTLTSELICYQDNQYYPAAENRKNEKYFSLLNNKKKYLEFQIPNSIGLIIKALLTPYRVHDTYAVDFTLTIENLPALEILSNLNFNFFSDLKPSLGKTLLLYAEPSASLTNYHSLSNTCINQLFVRVNNLELIAEGKLLDCPVYAYDNGEIDPSKHYHILICFNHNPPVSEQIDQATEYLLYLLWNRHKILYAYHQSRICVDNGRKKYIEIEQNIHNFSHISQSPERLQNFKILLTQLPQKSLEYSQLIRELQDHKNTIKISEKNYNNLLNKLKNLPDSNLNFVLPFLLKINNKFQAQLEAELCFLTLASQLFQELLNNIRGIVAIDQIENDRKFQEYLQKQEQQFEREIRQQEQDFQQTLQQKTEQFQTKLQEKEQQRLEQIRQQEEKSQEQEKKLEWFITLFGTGLAVSSISSAIAADLGIKIVQYLSIKLPSWWTTNELAKSSYSALVNLFFHIGVGVIFAFLAVTMLWLFQKK
jgi:hypothetical protein